MKDDRTVVKTLEFQTGEDAADDHCGKASAWRPLRSNRKGLLRKRWLALSIAAITVVSVCHEEFAQATPASGFTGTTLVNGTFAEFQVFNHLTREQLRQLAPGFPGDTWLSLAKTKGPSDLYVQTNIWQPGATTGWHRHPGHSLIIITSGQITQYHADCTSQVYGPGTANGPTLVDSGDDQHLIRNEGVGSATGVAVQLVANGAPRRLDEPAPESCPIP